MSPQTTSNLLNDWRLYVILRLPSFNLDGHLGSDHIADNQSTPDIYAPILASASYLDSLKTQFREKPANQVFEFPWVSLKEMGMKFLADAPIVLLNFKSKATPHPPRKTKISLSVLDEPR